MSERLRVLRAQIAVKIEERKAREIYDASRGGWIMDKSDFADYEKYFSMGLGPLNLRERLANVPSPTVIDLMAPTNALADLFEDLPQTDKLGIAVSTFRYRRDSAQRRSDLKKGVRVARSDLLTARVWENLDSRLKGRKVDLFVERGGWGMVYIPVNEELFNIAARLIWQRLNPNGGMILAQIPSFSQFAELGIDMYDWVNRLNSSGCPTMYFGGGGYLNNGKIFIQRLPDSPAKLPRL